MRIHDYFKFLKYGYDRTTDWCCWHIRRNRFSREEALKINEEKSGKFPNSYLGVSTEEILKEIDCTMDEFNEICDGFTNKELFKCNNEGRLIKKIDGSLIPNFKYITKHMSDKILVLDYKTGNVDSVVKSVKLLGYTPIFSLKKLMKPLKLLQGKGHIIMQWIN